MAKQAQAAADAAATENPATETEAAAEPAGPAVKVRILCAQGGWKPDDVAELPADEAAAAVAAGWADDHPEAVAFAESLTA
jgi:hypothetical protein